MVMPLYAMKWGPRPAIAGGVDGSTGVLFSANRGGPGVVLEVGVTPCSDCAGASRAGVPSGVAWLGTVQLGVRGVEARRSRRSSGPPGLCDESVRPSAGPWSQPMSGPGGPVDPAVQQQPEAIVVKAFEAVTDSADLLDEQVHRFGGPGRSTGGVMGQDLRSPRGQGLGQGADL